MPIRSCILCRKKQDKKDLIRIVQNDGFAVIDDKQKENKRGIYICNDTKCIDNCLKLIDKNKLNLKISVSHNSLKKLLENLKEIKED